MKNNNLTTLVLALFLCASASSFAQITTPATSQEAEVTQRVGITDITIHYNRPAVKGRKIWGGLVPYGFNDLGFGTSKSAPWRAGADMNTTIEFTHDVSFEGTPVKAGKYALFMAPKEDGNVTVILSSNTTSWGSYYYDQSEDVARAEVLSKDVDASRELLTFEFNTVTPESATATLHWEKKEIPFKIDVAVTDIVMAGIENDLRNSKSFNQNTWDQAAGYAFRNKDYDKALKWVNNSIEGNFFSKPTFANLSMKAQILMAQKKKSEALAVMDKAAPLANNSEIYGMVGQLIQAGEAPKALALAKSNVKKNDAAWPSNYALSKAYSANGDLKNAMKAINKSMEKAPERFKGRLNGELDKLKKGETIN